MKLIAVTDDIVLWWQKEYTERLFKTVQQGLKVHKLYFKTYNGSITHRIRSPGLACCFQPWTENVGGGGAATRLIWG